MLAPLWEKDSPEYCFALEGHNPDSASPYKAEVARSRQLPSSQQYQVSVFPFGLPLRTEDFASNSKTLLSGTNQTQPPDTHFVYNQRS
jgi:hypothetical protein